MQRTRHRALQVVLNPRKWSFGTYFVTGTGQIEYIYDWCRNGDSLSRALPSLKGHALELKRLEYKSNWYHLNAKIN